MPSAPLSSSVGEVSLSSGATLAGGRSHRPIPPKLYRIGEVVAYAGMSRQTVHNYTIMGLLHETQWTDGGHRLYDESVFRRLDQISEFKAQRKSLEFIREFFAGIDRNSSM